MLDLLPIDFDPLLQGFRCGSCAYCADNTRRLLGPIGDVPPAEFKAQYYAQAAVA